MTSKLSPLRLRRLHVGKTQLEVAIAANLAASRLSLMERGQVKPTEAERAALARILNCPKAELFAANEPL